MGIWRYHQVVQSQALTPLVESRAAVLIKTFPSCWIVATDFSMCWVLHWMWAAHSFWHIFGKNTQLHMFQQHWELLGWVEFGQEAFSAVEVWDFPTQFRPKIQIMRGEAGWWYTLHINAYCSCNTMDGGSWYIPCWVIALVGSVESSWRILWNENSEKALALFSS